MKLSLLVIKLITKQIIKQTIRLKTPSIRKPIFRLKYCLYFLFFNIAIAHAQTSAEKIPTGSNKSKPTIIALSPHIVEMLFDIGAGEQIIGTTEFSDYPEKAKIIPRIGNYIRLQLERIIELQPDLIIAWKSGTPSDDLARLTKLGFNVVYSQPNTFEDIASEIAYFATLTGHTEKGKHLSSKFLADLNVIKAKYSTKPEITVFYELWSRPLTTIAKGSWPQQHLDICRASNPWEEVNSPYPQVNIEHVLQKPIALIIQPISFNQKEREGFNWQDWLTIPAVKNNKIIKPDADALHRMTLRSLGELEKLCEEIDLVR